MHRLGKFLFNALSRLHFIEDHQAMAWEQEWRMIRVLELTLLCCSRGKAKHLISTENTRIKKSS